MINRVYYVKGLNHNLFSVGQFCDADLEVAFRKSTCFVRDLQGNDLLTGNRGSDLYTISLQETTSSTLICFLAKASLTQACPMQVESINRKKYILVIVDDYSRYTWTLFLRSKDEIPEVLKDFLKMIQCNLQAQVITIQTDKSTKFLNNTLHAYFKEEGIEHQTSTPRTPEQNGVAEAIATACYTQNRSIIISTHEKTAYHIINDRKPSIRHLHIFADTTTLSQQELDLLFSPLYDECFNAEPTTPTTNVNVEENNDNQAKDTQFQQDEFINPFCTPEAMADSAWIKEMEEELHQFDRLQVWELVDKPFGKTVIMLKWLWKNKKDEDQTESFAPVPRLEAVQIFIAYAAHKKALNGLKHASRSWYDELSNLLMSKGFTKGTIDPTLFTIRYGEDILLAKYALEILKKHGMDKCDSVGTPMATKPQLDADLGGKS
ncbi:retrovirus-related pol polyprotein from transposon TNT 1-94 [Tanacetum coccineum]